MDTFVLKNKNGFKKIAWGAVVAGVAIALSTEIVLNFLGIGIGLVSIELSPDQLSKVGIGSISWLLISGVVTMGLGGWIAGIVSDHFCPRTRILHGLLAWSFATLITAAVATTASGTIVGGASNIINNNIEVAIPDVLTAKSEDRNISSSGEHTQNTTIPTAINNATSTLGSTSIIIFIAFVLSAVSSAAGAFWGTPARTMQDESMNS